MELPPYPVIYVDKAGLYQCTVKYESQEVKGKLISVKVDVTEGMQYTFRQ